jgi:hypothetical protein
MGADSLWERRRSRYDSDVREELIFSMRQSSSRQAVDEKSQIQALDRTAPCLPILPTTPARMTHDYVRHGTTSLFAAYDVTGGSVIAQSFGCVGARHLIGWHHTA